MHLHRTYIRPLQLCMPDLTLAVANQGIQRSQHEEVHGKFTQCFQLLCVEEDIQHKRHMLLAQR